MKWGGDDVVKRRSGIKIKVMQCSWRRVTLKGPTGETEFVLVSDKNLLMLTVIEPVLKEEREEMVEIAKVIFGLQNLNNVMVEEEVIGEEDKIGSLIIGVLLTESALAAGVALWPPLRLIGMILSVVLIGNAAFVWKLILNEAYRKSRSEEGDISYSLFDTYKRKGGRRR